MNILRHFPSILLLSVAVLSIYSSGCFEGIPFIGPAVVYPHIVPVIGGTMPAPPTYLFAFQDRKIEVGIPVDASVYAGAKATDKSARVYDSALPEQEWREGIYRALINDPAQDGFYSEILANMRAERSLHSLDSDEYAELMAVFVQSIPYENQNLTSPRFPVETFVDGMGDCDDKSLLLAGLLSHEGYRAALLYFESERHMAVGVGCPDGGYRNTGYAYIETTNVSLVGIPPDTLAGGTTLSSNPDVIPVGNGTFNYTLCRETAAMWHTKHEMEQILARSEAEIRDMENQLDEKKRSLDTQRSSLENLLSAGDIGGYNRRVAAYNAEVSEYNRVRADLLRMVEKFNQIAEIHNYLVTHQHDRKGTWEWYSTLPGFDEMMERSGTL